MEEFKKKKYERPAMQVVELDKQSPLICQSPHGLRNPGNPGNAGDPFNP